MMKSMEGNMDATGTEAADSLGNRGPDGRSVLGARGVAQDRRGRVSSLVRSGYDAVAIDVGPALTQTMQEQWSRLRFWRYTDQAERTARSKGFLRRSASPIRGPGSGRAPSACIRWRPRHNWRPRGFRFLRDGGDDGVIDSSVPRILQHVQIETACGRQAGESGFHDRRDDRSQTLTMERGSSSGASVR